MKDVKEYFKTYPKSDECYQTSDGFIFHSKHDASGHAYTLKDKEIKAHERGAKEAADKAAKEAADKAAKEAADKAAKEAADKAAKEAAERDAPKGSVPKMTNPPKPPSSKKK